MQESFLHYIWQMQYFDKKELRTTQGDRIEIFNTGILNTHAGPDFANARIKIGTMDWVGSVEVHLQSREWAEHHHHIDAGYNNVVLHVVWKHDKDVYRSDGSLLPTLELRGRVDESLVKTYRQLMASAFSIPCKKSMPYVTEITKISMLEKALAGRLERKAQEVLAILQHNTGDWEETFYQLLARNFGFKVNAAPFFQLAKSLPLKVLLKHANRQSSVEALLFGQAGFLDGAKGDEYYLSLQREYRLLAHKYSLQSGKLLKSQWRFLRLRPANFPSLRLAQLASIIAQHPSLFSHVLQADDVSSLIWLFTSSVSPYWREHYQFSKKATSTVHELGRTSIDNIIINSVVSVWAAYSLHTDDTALMDRATGLLQKLPAEQNAITRAWKECGIHAQTSFDSQALIELYNNYCQRKNCLTCTIGASLVRPVK